jgi:hypothetical protein
LAMLFIGDRRSNPAIKLLLHKMIVAEENLDIDCMPDKKHCVVYALQLCLLALLI